MKYSVSKDPNLKQVVLTLYDHRSVYKILMQSTEAATVGSELLMAAGYDLKDRIKES